MTAFRVAGTIKLMFNPTLERGNDMKLWIKRSLYGLFGAGIVVGGLAACGSRYEWSHGGHMGGMHMDQEHSAAMHGKMIERVSSRLELNEEQKKRLVKLSDTLQEQRKALVGKTSNPRAEVQALIAGDKFDKARAQAIINEKTAVLGGKSPELLQVIAEFYDGLTPAQQQQVREFTQPRRRWWHQG